MSDLVGNPEDRVSHDKAHFISDTLDLSDMGSCKSKPTMKKKSSGSSKGSRLTKAGSSSKSGGQDDNMAAIGGRDTSIFLFRALGKILYCKSEFCLYTEHKKKNFKPSKGVFCILHDIVHPKYLYK